VLISRFKTSWPDFELAAYSNQQFKIEQLFQFCVIQTGTWQLASFNMDSGRGNKRQQNYDEDSGHDSDVGDYIQRRQRNNVAVRKSRQKSRSLAHQTAQRVTELRRENNELEGKVGLLSKELKLLKDVLLMRAGKGVSSENDCAESTTVDSTNGDGNSSHLAECDSVHQDHIYVAKRFKR